MKFHDEDIHNRTIRFSEIQDDKVQEMDVCIGYPGEGDLRKGIVIDRIVVPHIMKGLQLAEIFKDVDTLEVKALLENAILDGWESDAMRKKHTQDTQ